MVQSGDAHDPFLRLFQQAYIRNHYTPCQSENAVVCTSFKRRLYFCIWLQRPNADEVNI